MINSLFLDNYFCLSSKKIVLKAKCFVFDIIIKKMFAGFEDMIKGKINSIK
jgi:hypothetical protein